MRKVPFLIPPLAIPIPFLKFQLVIGQQIDLFNFMQNLRACVNELADYVSFFGESMNSEGRSVLDWLIIFMTRFCLDSEL